MSTCCGKQLVAASDRQLVAFSYLSLVILSTQSHHDSSCAVDTTYGHLNLGSRKSVHSTNRSLLRSMTVSVDTAALRELNIRLTESEVSENDSTKQECSVDKNHVDRASCSRNGNAEYDDKR